MDSPDGNAGELRVILRTAENNAFSNDTDRTSRGVEVDRFYVSTGPKWVHSSTIPKKLVLFEALVK